MPPPGSGITAINLLIFEVLNAHIFQVMPHFFLQDINFNFFLNRIVASGCFRRWRREAAYLRCLHGFLQSAPQLILQSVIVLKGVHIHSLHQTVEAVQKALQSGQTDGVTVLDSLSYLTQDKPLRWFWGLIQASFAIKKIKFEKP